MRENERTFSRGKGIMTKKTAQKSLPVLTRPIAPLPDNLKGEWADPRQPEYVAMREKASWKCPNGHPNYEETRERRARYGKGCPVCAGKASPAALQMPAPKAKRASKAPATGPAPVAAPAPSARPAPSTPPAPSALLPPSFRALSARDGGFVVRDALLAPMGLFAFQLVKFPPAQSRPRATRRHVLVVDRSGSMYGDMTGLQSTLIKLLAVEELRRPDVLLSLVSYSSTGDVTEHFRDVRADGIGQREINEINRLRPTGLTCMSGGLRAALGILNASPLGTEAVVTLHSDGYANDASPMSERRAILDTILPALASVPGVTVNTIAYRSSSDFNFLAQIANAGRGVCIQAGSLADLASALERVQRSVTGAPVAQYIEVARADREYILAINPARQRTILHAPRKVRAAGSEIVRVEADDVAFRVWPVDDASALHRLSGMVEGSVAVAGPAAVRSYSSQAQPEHVSLMLAFARGLIGVGEATLGKLVAVSTGVVALGKHARALTGPQIAALAAETETQLWGPTPGARHALTPVPAPALTLPELLALLGKWRSSIKVHVPTLMEGYKRVGVRRVPGKWVDGKLARPLVDVAPRRAGAIGSDGWADLTSIEINGEEAAINLTCAQPVDLVRWDSEERTGTPTRLGEVAGVSLEHLRTFRSFTILADGAARVDSLPIRVTSVAAWIDLRASGVAACGGNFDPTRPVDVSLNLPLLRSARDVAPPNARAIRAALAVSTLAKLLRASLSDGEERTGYAPEQIAALRDVHLTPSLYFSPPTTYAYPDVKRAQIEGKIDSRVRYRVTFGADGILSPSELSSPSALIQRHFVVTQGGSTGVPIEKPTAIDFFNPANSVRAKTDRQKPSPEDDVALPLYRFAMSRRAQPATFPGAVALPFSPPRGEWSDAAARRETLDLCEKWLDSYYERRTDAVFFVGATGTVPQSWGPALTAEDLERATTGTVVVPKAYRDGAFYRIEGDGVMAIACVRAEESLYSVD